MLPFIRLYSVEILSIAMGIWLLWIILTYKNYFKELKTCATSKELASRDEFALQKARDKRKRTYNLAVTYPSYAIFWVTVIAWGISYLLKASPL